MNNELRLVFKESRNQQYVRFFAYITVYTKEKRSNMYTDFSTTFNYHINYSVK